MATSFLESKKPRRKPNLQPKLKDQVQDNGPCRGSSNADGPALRLDKAEQNQKEEEHRGGESDRIQHEWKGKQNGQGQEDVFPGETGFQRLQFPRRQPFLPCRIDKIDETQGPETHSAKQWEKP